MTTIARVFSTASIFATALAWTPSFAADYTIRFGEVHGPAYKTVDVATTTLKMCEKSTGYRFGYEVVTARNRSYETYALIHIPGQPKPHRLTNLRRQGTFAPYFWFDPGDPVGTYTIDVFVDGNKAATVSFQVVSPMSCPLNIDALLAGSCSEAVKRLNAQNRANNAWYVERYRAAFGSNPKDFRVDYGSIDHCRKMLPISKARFERETEFGKLDNAFMRKCPHATQEDTPAYEGLSGRTSNSRLMDGIREGIELCEKTLAGDSSAALDTAKTSAEESVFDLIRRDNIVRVLKAVPTLRSAGFPNVPKQFHDEFRDYDEFREYSDTKLTVNYRRHKCWADFYSAKIAELDFANVFVDEQKELPGVSLLAIPCKNGASCVTATSGNCTKLTRSCTNPCRPMMDRTQKGLSFGAAPTPQMREIVSEVAAAAKR